MRLIEKARSAVLRAASVLLILGLSGTALAGGSISEFRTSNVKLYDSPGGGSKSVAKEELATPLAIHDEQRGYYQVEHQGQLYWIRSSQVKSADLDTPPPCPEDKLATAGHTAPMGSGEGCGQ